MKKWAIAHKDGENSLMGIKNNVEKRVLQAKNHIQMTGKFYQTHWSVLPNTNLNFP